MFADAGQRLLLSHLEVHVHQLVRERRELVAEAHDVDARLVGVERVRVELRLHLLVDLVLLGVLQRDVHVVLASGHNLDAKNH